MRSDVKVAMAIAVILIGIGVVWVVFFNDDAPKDQKTDVEKIASPNGSETNKAIVSKPLTKPDPIPSLTSEKALITSPYGEKEKDSTKTTTVSKDATADSSDNGASKTRAGDWSSVPYKPERVTPSWMITETTKKTGTTGTWTGLTTTAKTYVVKDNDSYWSIAKKLWGDGSLYPHLEKANPGVSPGDLRPRMTIKVPPKPVRKGSASSSTAVATARHGTTGVDPLTRKRYYIVKEGDRGFWDVSKAVYGHGKHYGLIEKANPELDSRRLRPGKKVWCPDKPVKVVSVKVKPALSGTGYADSTKKTVPAAASTGGADAPTKITLPDGRVFD